jgi:hypothetical protein
MSELKLVMVLFFSLSDVISIFFLGLVISDNLNNIKKLNKLINFN